MLGSVRAGDKMVLIEGTRIGGGRPHHDRVHAAIEADVAVIDGIRINRGRAPGVDVRAPADGSLARAAMLNTRVGVLVSHHKSFSEVSTARPRPEKHPCSKTPRAD